MRLAKLAALFLCPFAFFLCLGADRQILNRGDNPGDGTGDSRWIYIGKANANFEELFSRFETLLLDNGTPLYGRNFDNDDNVALIKLNTSDQVEIASDGTPTLFGDYIRVPNDTGIYGRNALDTANVHIAQVDTANRVYVDAGANGLIIGKNLTIAGTTNQIVFGGTNTAPASPGAPTKWVSVQVNGESTVYRLPLYQ